MRRATLIALAMLATLVASVASAQAAVRGGTTVDPLDAQDTTPSLDPRPVTPDLTRVSVAYDEAGSVAVSAEFASAESFTPRLELQLACTDEPVFTVRISRERNLSDMQGGWTDAGVGELAGIAGKVFSATHAVEGSRTLTATFTHVGLANRGYRCASGGWEARTLSGDARPDRFALWFTGFEPQRLTTTTARQRADQELRSALSTRYSAARTRYLRCADIIPAEDPFAEPDENAPIEEVERQAANPASAQALCQYFLVTGRRVTLGSVTVSADDQARTLAVKRHPALRYTRRWRSCRLPRGGGTLRSNEPCGGPQLLAQDIGGMASRRFPRPLPRRFSVWAHGTNTAGHPSLFRYRCTPRHSFGQAYGHPVRRYTVRCANAVGERFESRFSMA